MMNDVGLLIARATIGTSMAAHGAQKAFGWYNGPGPEKAAGSMERMGFEPGDRYAQAAAWTEIAGGTLTAIGLGGPIGPALVLSTMIVAQTTDYEKSGKYFNSEGGNEIAILYGAAALALVSSGPGAIALDGALNLGALRNPWITTVAVAGAAIGAFAILGQRTKSPRSAPEQPKNGVQQPEPSVTPTAA